MVTGTLRSLALLSHHDLSPSVSGLQLGNIVGLDLTSD